MSEEDQLRLEEIFDGIKHTLFYFFLYIYIIHPIRTLRYSCDGYCGYY